MPLWLNPKMRKSFTGRGHDTRYVRLQKNFCFACGMSNPDGMRLKFVFDEGRDRFVCRFRLSKRYTGPPGHAHGGIIATILDEAMGKVNKQTNRSRPSSKTNFRRVLFR